MIERISTISKSLEELLQKNKFQNPYLWIDVSSFGLNDGKKFGTYVSKNKFGAINFVIFRYYDTAQLIGFGDDLKDLYTFIAENNIRMLTCSSKYLHKIELDNYKKTFGFLMCFRNDAETIAGFDADMFFPANENDFKGIAELICSDNNIGGHYDVLSLEKQLRERNYENGYRNLVSKNDGRIVCHVGTYAESKEFAIIGGVITSKDFRNKGYAKNGILALIKQLLPKGQMPLLYCYDLNIVKYYEKIGFEICEEIGKLERI